MIPTVSKFFCCIPLEIGMHILAFWVILKNLLEIGMTIALWIISKNPSMIDYIRKQIPEIVEFYKNLPDYMLQIWFFLFTIFWSIFCIYAAARLIRSRSSRNRSDVLPYLIVIIISFALTITTEFTYNIYSNFTIMIISIILATALEFYIFICVFSMYKRLENESFGRERLLDDGYGNQTQYQSISA